jgi:hypothetical protein
VRKQMRKYCEINGCPNFACDDHHLLVCVDCFDNISA